MIGSVENRLLLHIPFSASYSARMTRRRKAGASVTHSSSASRRRASKQRAALRGWARHYEAVNDQAQAKEFGKLQAEFEGKLRKRLRKARANVDLRAIAQLPG